MCRFMSYLGHPIILHDVLYKPKNSLMKQSVHARETTEHLNGDGFGVGWYIPEIDNTPAIFKSIQPAWNDQNIQYLSAKIFSGCFFAHVRAASSGGVAYANTHPFAYKNYLFMHNGDVGNFNKIKRHLREKLSDEMYNWIQGQTDSEHFFALFLDLLKKRTGLIDVNVLASVLNDTIRTIENIRKTYDIEDAAYITAVVSDGKHMVGVRYISNPHEQAMSLHYTQGSRYEFRDGLCHMISASGEKVGAVLLASEKLDNHRADWSDIPNNHMILIDEALRVELRKIAP